MIAGYGITVGLIGLTRLDRAGAPLIVAAHLALPLLALLAARASDSSSGRFLRSCYPIILLTGLYSSLDVLNRFGATHTWDAPLLRAEAALFGGQPSRDWWRASPSAFWSALLHAVYFSYYVIVPLPVIVFAALKRRAPWNAISRAHCTFLVCYLVTSYSCCRPVITSSAATGAFVDNGRPDGLRHPRARQRLRRGVPVVARRGDRCRDGRAWHGSRRLGVCSRFPRSAAVGVCSQMHYVLDSVGGCWSGWWCARSGAKAGEPLAVSRQMHRRLSEARMAALQAGAAIRIFDGLR